MLSAGTEPFASTACRETIRGKLILETLFGYGFRRIIQSHSLPIECLKF